MLLSSSEFFAIMFILYSRIIVQFGETVYRDKERWCSLDAIMLSGIQINTVKERQPTGARSYRLSSAVAILFSMVSERLGYASESRSALVDPYREAILRPIALYDSAKAHKGHSQYAGRNHRYGHILHCLGQVSFSQLLANAGKYNQC